MARTKQTARSSTVGVSTARIARRMGAIAKKTPAPEPMMQMPPYFFRVMKEIKHICQTYNAMSTWEFPRIRKKEFAGQLVHNNGTNFGVIVDKFQMKPTMSSDTGMLIKSTTILAEVPANYPFSPPRVTFKDKITHPDIDSDGVYIGKMREDWSPCLSLTAYVSGVQHDLFFAA